MKKIIVLILLLALLVITIGCNEIEQARISEKGIACDLMASQPTMDVEDGEAQGLVKEDSIG